MAVEPSRYGYWFVSFVARCYFVLLFGLKRKGLENIPKDGAFIYASNHQSWWDPPIVGSTSTREIHFAAKKELFSVPILGPLVRYLNSIPVKRSGFDREAIVRLGEVLDNKGGVIIFPEGTRFLDGNLHPPKAGVGMLTSKHNVPIVPVYVSGSARIRRQIFRRKLTITYGIPFRISEIPNLPEGKERYQLIAEETMRRIAKTGNVSLPVFTSGSE